MGKISETTGHQATKNNDLVRRKASQVRQCACYSLLLGQHLPTGSTEENGGRLAVSLNKQTEPGTWESQGGYRSQGTVQKRRGLHKDRTQKNYSPSQEFS